MSKKLLTFLTLLTLFFGVGWAADEIIFTFDDTYGTTAITSDAKLREVTTITGSGSSIFSSFTVGNNILYGEGYGGIRFGKSSSSGEITINLSQNILPSSIKVYGKRYNTSKAVTLTLGGEDVSTTTSDQFATYSTSGTWSESMGAITIAASKYFLVKEITITYTSGGTPQPTNYALTLPTGLTGGTVTATGYSDLTAIPSGTSMTVTATPSSDSYELDWMKANGTEVSNPYNFNITANTTITAAFKEKQVTPPTPTGTNRFERITSLSDLEAGKRYLLVYESETTTAVMGEITSSNTYGASVTSGFTLNNGVIVLDANTTAKPVTLGGSTGAWTFEMDGTLIGQTAKNSLKLDADNNTWAIAFDNENAEISHSVSNTDYTIRYNATSPRFAGYAGTQEKIYLYKEVAETTTDKLYLIGYGMNGTENWNLTTAPQMTYSAGSYAVDVYFDKAQRGMFQFAKGLSNSNSNWGGLTGRLYPSTNGSNVSVDTYDMDGTVGLYFTDNSNMYSFELPAGLYTITANLSEWKTYVTQKPVTMTISPNSATFDDTKNVTLASNLTELGGKIYYTTDGTTPSASNGTEYTGTITLEATTTIKAIAILNYIQSEVVEKTYTKTPAAPVITPASCAFNEPLTVTITAEEGATIYYTIDGSNPTDQSTQYTGPFTVSTTTTVKAKAYVDGVYGATAQETYTYSNVQPSTGDFVLVTSASQLVAGNEYIIINSDRTAAAASYSSSKFGVTDNFTLSNDYSTATPGNDVKIFTLEAGNESGAFYMKDDSNNYYYPLTGGTDINTGKELVYISYSDGFTYIKGSTTSTRSIAYNHQASNHVFGSYTNPTTTGNQRPVYLYTRESNSVQPPVFTPAGGVYDVPVDVTISCATTGASIYYTTDGTEPSATNGTLYDGEEFVVSETTTYKAVAVKNGNTSSVVTAEYTITPHTAIETVTLDYREPFTAGIGKFTVQNASGFAPVWTLDGEFGIKGTSYSANTNPTNNAAVSRFLSPIIDMTDATKPELTFSHQINNYFNDVTTQATLWIRETSNGTSGTWVQLPITFSDPAAAGGWTNDVVDIDLTDVNGVSYAGKKVQISFLYTNPNEGSGAGTWEIQHFVVADNSEYKMVNNIAEFLALPENTKAKFRNPVTVLYDYAQYSSNSYHEYIWVKDESGYMQFYLIPTLNSSTESTLDAKAAYYENGDIIPGGFVVTKNYYTNGKYIQAFSDDALNAGFQAATQKGLADPEYMDFGVLNNLDASDTTDVANWSNHYITLEKIKLTSSSKNFNFQDENGTTNSCVGYNKYNDDGSLLKDGTTSADVIMPTDLTKFYNVKAILQLWQGGWEIMPVEFTEWKINEVTLRELCQNGVENNQYTISNRLLGVYAQGNKLWLKDDNGQSILKTAPAEGDNNYEIGKESGNKQLNQAYYDQSNWLEVQLTDNADATLFMECIIKGSAIKGTFSNKLNPTMTGVTLAENAIEDLYATTVYNPNYYCTANFMGSQQTCQGSEQHGKFFFMNPKPQEYAQIVWAQWDGTKFVIPTGDGINEHGFTGEFNTNMELNVNTAYAPQTGKAYNFRAIVRKVAGSSKNTTSDTYMVYPLNLADDVITDIADVAGKTVTGIRYYNVAGMASDRPFEGINIVVTTYTDGSRSSSKVLK